MTRDAVSVYESKRVGGEEVVLSELVKGGVVVVVVYAEVNDELVVRGSELKEKRVGPGEWVWFFGSSRNGKWLPRDTAFVLRRW